MSKFQQNKSPVDLDTVDALILRKLGERISNLEKENETLHSALFYAIIEILKKELK